MDLQCPGVAVGSAVVAEVPGVRPGQVARQVLPVWGQPWPLFSPPGLLVGRTCWKPA